MKLLFLIFFFPALGIATDILSFNWNKEKVFKLNRKELQKKSLQINGRDITVQKIKIYDKLFKQNKTYKGIELATLLTAIYGKKWYESYKIKFAALDGYRTSNEIKLIKMAISLGHTPYLIYKEVGQNSFSPYYKGRKRINFAPFYVVWSGLDKEKVKKKSLKKLKWPYQLKEINISLPPHRRNP